MAILVGGFYKAGDRVMVGGIRGDVIDLGVLRTTVMELGEWVDGDLYNGRIVRIANSFVFKEPVFNYSADFPFLWDEIKIPVRYGSDYRLAKELITETGEAIIGDFVTEAQKHWDVMVRKYMIENASTGIMVTLVATDNWVEFTLRYVVDYQRRRSIKNELFLQILDAVDRTEGQIKLASATHEITDLPPIDVMMR
jgi:small-conductance mechanosensitive channel